MFGDRQGRGFCITQLRAVTSSPAISAIRNISLVLRGTTLLTEKDNLEKYQTNELCEHKISGEHFHSLPSYNLTPN
jgi:hypothetical protein